MIHTRTIVEHDWYDYDKLTVWKFGYFIFLRFHISSTFPTGPTGRDKSDPMPKTITL